MYINVRIFFAFLLMPSLVFTMEQTISKQQYLHALEKERENLIKDREKLSKENEKINKENDELKTLNHQQQNRRKELTQAIATPPNNRGKTVK